MAKQKQIKMQVQVGALAAIQQLEHKTDEQLQGESRHRVAAKALLGARAAERYDAKTARAYFNEALAGCHPQERPALRQMMKASMALAERRPDELKEAVERLGQAPPSGRQLFLLRIMGLVAPPPGASLALRARGHPAAASPSSCCWWPWASAWPSWWRCPSAEWAPSARCCSGSLIVAAVLGVLTLFGRRRQARMKAERAAGPG